MNALNNLLDKAKETRSLPSDMALAARLGKTRSLISAWRKGDKLIQDDDIAQLADLAKLPPERCLVMIRAEQSHGKAHAAWERLARQLGMAASLAFVTLFSTPFANAGVEQGIENPRVGGSIPSPATIWWSA
ncbi:MAG: hypothetical protein ACREPE_11825 [Lysobacter sp.]